MRSIPSIKRYEKLKFLLDPWPAEMRCFISSRKPRSSENLDILSMSISEKGILEVGILGTMELRVGWWKHVVP